MPNPFFSIIVPTFNRSFLLKQALQSVCYQTLNDWEVIVVDDGGSDQSRDICSRFNEPRIHYYWKANEERSIARNYGAARAKGLYLNFLDSDDFLLPCHLEKACDYLRSHRFPMVLNVGWSRASGDSTLPVPVTHTDITCSDLLATNALAMSALFIKSQAFDEIRFPCSPHAIIAEDWCLWLRLSARHVIASAPFHTACVRFHSGRSIENIDPFKYQSSILIVVSILDRDLILQSVIGSSDYSFFKARQILSIAQHFLICRRRYRLTAIQYIVDSLALSPRVLLTKVFWVCMKKLLPF